MKPSLQSSNAEFIRDLLDVMCREKELVPFDVSSTKMLMLVICWCVFGVEELESRVAAFCRHGQQFNDNDNS